MNGYDGAELCDLIGISTQSVSQDIINKEAMGLYTDDGLIVLNKVTSQKTDKIEKKIIQVFKDNGFSIDIVTNLVEVNFLDITFNLINASYRPYTKPNDEIKYINVLHNYPPQILKQLTSTISDRLSRNSSSNLIFNESKHRYEDVLSKRSFKTSIKSTSEEQNVNLSWKNNVTVSHCITSKLRRVIK